MLTTALLRDIERLRNDGTAFCVATIVEARGSIPQEVGARALFTVEGLAGGTIGGGRIETWAAEVAAELLAGDPSVRTCVRRLNLHRDIGMTCAGEVTVYIEVYRPDADWTIAIFGAGHVAQKLCRFLVELDCTVLCFDPREEWLARLPAAPNLRASRVDSYVEGVTALPPDASVIVMTMGHETDRPVLAALAAAGPPPPYLGVIGSDSKAAILRRELRDAGVAADFVDSIVCPLGDKIGNNTPAEIAVGVLAQLVRRRRGTEDAAP